MSIYKCKMFFRSGIVGWTENYYTDQGSHAQAALSVRKLAVKRIMLCGVGIDLPFIRISDISIRGDSFDDGDPGYTTTAGKPGFLWVKSVTDPEKADVAGVAALFTISAQNVAVGRIYARGLPDDFDVADRIFAPDINWDKAFTAFSKEFSSAAGNYVVIRKLKSTPANTGTIQALQAVLGANLVVLHSTNVTFSAGQLVAIRGCKTTDGKRFSGNFVVVTSTPGNTHVYKTFADPQPVFSLNKGTIQSATPGVLNQLNISYARLTTTRKAGRPFGVPVGRRRRVPTLQ